jgi:hypothetical protein
MFRFLKEDEYQPFWRCANCITGKQWIKEKLKDKLRPNLHLPMLQLNFWRASENSTEMKFVSLIKKFFHSNRETEENTKIGMWIIERFFDNHCGINFNKIYPSSVYDFANSLYIFLRHSKYEIAQKLLKTIGIQLPGTNSLQKRTDYSTSLFGADALIEIKKLLIDVNDLKKEDKENIQISLSVNFDQIFVERKPTLKANHILSGQIFQTNIFYKCIGETGKAKLFNIENIFDFNKDSFPDITYEKVKYNSKAENWEIIFQIFNLELDSFFPYKASLSAFEVGQYLYDLISIFKGKNIGSCWIIPEYENDSKNPLYCPFPVKFF